MIRPGMECDRGRLEGLLAGRLDPLAEARVEQHLATCDACRATLEALAAGGEWWADLRRLDGPGVTRVDPPGSDRGDGLPPDWLEPSDIPGSVGRLGPYEVTGVLGRGGMGVVLRGFDPTLGRPVAIKVIAPELAASGPARRRFAREARAAAAVTHDHVVAIHAVAESTGGLPYLVMPLVAGRSLQERIDADGALGVAEILRIGMQTASGLAGAHAQGLVHRDIKPANILLENGVERVKITDFGLARVVDDASMSQSGVVAGTPEYMSPEQARGDAVDARSDLFSLGSVLYTMATGHPPFRAGNPLAVLRRISDDDPRPIRAVNAEIPAWLAAIIMRLLSKHPSDRYESASAVAELLGQCLAHVQGSDRSAPPALLARPGLVAPRVARRRWVLSGLLATAASLILGIVGLAAAGPNEVLNLLATIIRIKTPEGTLVVEVDDPATHLTIDGQDLVLTGPGQQEIRLKTGSHHLLATRDGKPFRDDLFTIQRDDKVVVRIRHEADAVPVTPTVMTDPTTGRPIGVKLATPPASSAPASPAPPTVDPKEGTVVTYPRWYRPEPARSGPRGPATVVMGPVIPGLEQADLLQPVALDDPSPVPLWPGSSVTYQAYSPDGATLALTSNLDLSRDGKREILLFDAATRRRKAVLTGHSARIWTMVFSPDGRKLAAATGDWGYPARSGKVHLWDLDKPDQPSVVIARDIPLAFGVAFAPDGKTLTYASWDDTVVMYDLDQRKVRATCRGHEDAARFVAYSPDGRTLASAGWDKTIRFWDPTTGEPQGPIIGPVMHAVNAISFSPDGKLIAGAVHGSKPPTDPSLGDRVMVWDVATRAVRAELVGHKGVVFFTAFAPDGRTLASSGGLKDHFGDVKLWDTTSWTERRTLGGFRSWIGCVAYSPDGRSMVAASDHGGQRAEVRIYNLEPSPTPSGEFRPEDSTAWSLAYAPDGKTLAVSTGPFSRHGHVWLRDLATSKTAAAYRTPLAARTVIYSRDGSRLASGSLDGTIVLSDAAGREVHSFRAFNESVTALAFAPDGKTLAAAASDGTIQFFDVTGKLIHRVEAGEALSLAYSPDGGTLAAGMRDGSIAFWDAATRARRSALAGHAQGVAAVAFSRSGRLLASASWDKTIKLWDAFATGDPTTLVGHDQPIRALAFAPDGQTLASADGAEGEATVPGVVRLWDLPGGTARGVLRAAKSRLWSVAFAPDGKSLAAAGEDGTVNLWTR